MIPTEWETEAGLEACGLVGGLVLHSADDGTDGDGAVEMMMESGIPDDKTNDDQPCTRVR